MSLDVLYAAVRFTAWGFIMTRGEIMMLDVKYVLHIPLYRFAGDGLVRLDIDEMLDELIADLCKSGFESFYITNVESFYRSRRFEEILITVFSDETLKSPDMIFREWIERNCHILAQEAYSYERDNKMFIICGEK